MTQFSGEVGFVQSGRSVVFEDFSSEGPMWSHEGDREAIQKIDFQPSFFEPPTVQLSIVLLDARTDSMMRYNILARNVTERGFEICFQTWSDSKFARCHVQWIAFGRAMRDEYWADF